MDLEKHYSYYLLFSILFFLCSACVKSRVNSELCEAIETASMNSSLLISNRGYKSETHTVITKDGYILTMFRIPKRTDSVSFGPPVLLVHGIADSSDSWVVLDPKESLAFLLADAGYDVWIMNCRGNKYSKTHVNDLPPKQFWDFSYEEMGTEDLPATIDYILKATEASQVSYIGFSQGTTAFLVMCSLRPEYNQKVRQAVLLAPVAWTGHISFPFLNFWTENIDSIHTLLASIGIYEVFPDSPPFNVFHAKICKGDTALLFLCQLRHFFTLGLSDIRRVPSESRPAFASHIPAGTSAKTFVHYIKAITSKQFRRYDYGKDGNQQLYNTYDPPDYDLTSVTVPITMMASEADWFSDPVDVKVLRSSLKSIIKYVMFNKTMGLTHVEFVYGNSAKQLVNYPILKLLDTEKL